MWIRDNVYKVTLYNTVSKGYLLLLMKLGSPSRYIVTKRPYILMPKEMVLKLFGLWTFLDP